MPQSFVVDPFNFLVVIYDFPHSCEFTKSYMCAHDAETVAVKTETQLVRSNFDNISLWCFENRMTLYAGKRKDLKFRGPSEF